MKISIFLLICLFTGKIFAQHREITTKKSEGFGDEGTGILKKTSENLDQTIVDYDANKNKVKEHIKTFRHSLIPNDYILQNETITNHSNQYAESTAYYSFKPAKIITKTTYNAKKQKIKEETITYDGLPSQVVEKQIQEYVYYENGLLKYEKDSTRNWYINTENESWRSTHYAYFYDEKGRITEKQYISPFHNDNPQGTDKYIYLREANTATEIVIRTGQYGTYSDTTRKVYDERENMILLKNSYNTTTYEYDNLNQKIASYAKSTWSVENQTFAYDTKGNIIKATYYYNDRFSGLAHRTEWKYESVWDFDDKNRIITEKTQGWSKSNYGSAPAFVQSNYEVNTTYTYETIEGYEPEKVDFLLYPNPANAEVQITNTISLECMKGLKILRTDGSLVENINYVFKNSTETKNGACSATISLQNIPAGLYFVVIETGDGQRIGKQLFVKK